VLPSVSNFTSADTFLQVVSPDGRILDRSDNLGPQKLPWDPRLLASTAEGSSSYANRLVAGERLRVFTTPLRVGDTTIAVLQVARPTRELEETRRLLTLALLTAGAGGLALALGVGWWLAGMALAPVRRVTQTARAIAVSGEPDRRLSFQGPQDELGALCATFNTMLDRLSTVLAAQRRFVQDASHELRTPMTTLRLNIHSLLRDDSLDPAERREILTEMGDEIDRLSRLVSGLLELARADAGRQPARDAVALDEVVREASRSLETLARGRLRLELLDPAELMGSRDGLRQMVVILLDNALKVSPPDDPVTIRLVADDASRRATLEVSDHGPGIAAEDMPHLFERFYRSAAARQTSGTGLGLAIARTIVDEHGGRIEAICSPDGGATFRVTIPFVAGVHRPAPVEPAPRDLPVGAAR
jgi:signal transduction histidine kinase